MLCTILNRIFGFKFPFSSEDIITNSCKDLLQYKYKRCKLKFGLLQECSKLAQQINRVYGANKQLTHPAHIYLTGIKMDGLLRRELHSKCSGFEN